MKTCKFREEDESTGLETGDYCGEPAKWLNCSHIPGLPVCEKHKCRCRRPIPEESVQASIRKGDIVRIAEPLDSGEVTGLSTDGSNAFVGTWYASSKLTARYNADCADDEAGRVHPPTKTLDILREKFGLPRQSSDDDLIRAAAGVQAELNRILQSLDVSETISSIPQAVNRIDDRLDDMVTSLAALTAGLGAPVASSIPGTLESVVSMVAKAVDEGKL